MALLYMCTPLLTLTSCPFDSSCLASLVPLILLNSSLLLFLTVLLCPSCDTLLSPRLIPSDPSQTLHAHPSQSFWLALLFPPFSISCQACSLILACLGLLGPLVSLTLATLPQSAERPNIIRAGNVGPHRLAWVVCVEGRVEVSLIAGRDEP
jgi:hypothetical protein